MKEGAFSIIIPPLSNKSFKIFNKTIYSNNNILASAKTTVNLSAGKDVIVKSNDMVILQCGNSSIVLKENGQIFLVGKEIFIASDKIEIKGAEAVKISSKKIDLN